MRISGSPFCLITNDVSYELDSVHPSICPFTTQDLKIDLSVFSDILHEDREKVRKFPDFWEKIPGGLGGPEKSQNVP